jgi:hypothetical protein
MSHQSAPVPSLARSWLPYAAVSCSLPSFFRLLQSVSFPNLQFFLHFFGVAGLTGSKYRRSFLSDRTRQAQVGLLSLFNRRRSSNFALQTPDFLRPLQEPLVGTVGQYGGQDSFHLYLVGFPLPPYRSASHRLLCHHTKRSDRDSYSQQCYDKPAPCPVSFNR